jgi:hypothetical protein
MGKPVAGIQNDGPALNSEFPTFRLPTLRRCFLALPISSSSKRISLQLEGESWKWQKYALSLELGRSCTGPEGQLTRESNGTEGGVASIYIGARPAMRRSSKKCRATYKGWGAPHLELARHQGKLPLTIQSQFINHVE